MRKLLISLLGLSAVLILGGVSLLFGRPASVPPLPTAQSATSAYESQLVIAYDVATSPAHSLAFVGGALTLGGLMVSAATLGRRLGREASDAK